MALPGPAERLEEFRAAYGPGGDWARLFRKVPGYLGTTLHELGDGWFETTDRWAHPDDLDIVMVRFGKEYQELDARCAALTLEEKELD